MKRLIFLSLLFLTLSCKDQQNKDFIIVDGKSIGSLKLNEKLDPYKIREDIGYKIDSDSIIIELYTSDKRYITLKGVKVGDSIKKVKEKYGESIKLRGGQNRIIGELNGVLFYRKIIFIYENDTIKTIGIQKRV